MRFAVFGAGALGGYFGARLLQAGHEVAFVARGAQLAALRANGLVVSSPLGDVRLPSVQATDRAADIGPVDLVMLMVKLQDTEAASAALAPLLGDDTAVVSFQNGVDGWRRIGERIGHERVIGGTAYIFAHLAAPGHVVHTGGPARLLLGEFDGSRSARAKRLHEALVGAGVAAELVDDIDARLWEKFVLLSALSALTALTRLSIGEVLADPLCASLFRDALEESAAVGHRECATLAPDVAERQWTFARSLPPAMHASMLDDLERGKPLELEHLSGAVVRLAARHGLAAPVHDTVRRALHPYVGGTPGRSPAAV